MLTHAYGAAVRHLWALEPEVTYLSHGSYGATPLEVLAVQQEWRRHIEANPVRAMFREYPRRVRESAAAIGELIHAAPEDVVFVESATSGMNAVLRSLEFQPGDEILVTNLAYGAITKAARYAARVSGAKLVTAHVPLPLPGAEAARDAVVAAITPRTRLVVIDHIVSPTGFILPVRAIADAAHAAGAQLLIDGAHAPGHIPLIMSETGADWYVGDLHKWLFVPRACGFLWSTGAARDLIHPLSISHGYEQGMTAEFDWTGTRDPSAILSIPAAIAFHEKLGGTALMERNAGMLREGIALIAAALQTPPGAPLDLFASLGTVALPARFGSTAEDAATLRLRLAEDHRFEVLVVALEGTLWLRVAAQAYNELADYRRLADVLEGL